MQADYSTIIRPGAFVHMIYLASAADADGQPAITERVVLVRELDPDGLGFRGWCIRRWWESGGGRCRRRFAYDRIRAACEWDGSRIATPEGYIVIPSMDGLTWLADWWAEHTARRAAAVAA